MQGKLSYLHIVQGFAVRNIVVKQSTPIGGVKPTLFAQGTYIGGQFYIENVGGTRAYILESHCQVFWTDKGLPMERPYEGKDPNIPISRDCELQAGQSMPIIFQSERLMDDRADDILAGNSYWKIYVMGWIAYGDDLGIRRRTAFCREYRGALNAAEGRFYPVGDSDYEQEN